MRTVVVATLSVVLSWVGVALAADVKLDGVKCILNPKAAAKADKTAEYKGGSVFFCCDNCPKAFAKDPKKHATAANHQLVATGQAKQKACPLSGGDLNPATKTQIGGVDVCFCCEKCQAKAKEGGVETVFNDKAFDQAFKVAK